MSARTCLCRGLAPRLERFRGRLNGLLCLCKSQVCNAAQLLGRSGVYHVNERRRRYGNRKAHNALVTENFLPSSASTHWPLMNAWLWIKLGSFSPNDCPMRQRATRQHSAHEGLTAAVLAFLYVYRVTMALPASANASLGRVWALRAAESSFVGGPMAAAVESFKEGSARLQMRACGPGCVGRLTGGRWSGGGGPVRGTDGSRTDDFTDQSHRAPDSRVMVREIHEKIHEILRQHRGLCRENE